jgi:NTP pyrophosphatase (non-canonical NTP hydrolase)
MKNVNIPRIHQEIESFIQERDWDQFHSVKNLAMALSVESSELVEIFQWMSEEKSNLIRNDEVVKNKLQDEVADVLFYLLRIAHKADIDLEEAVLQKIKKNAAKYPVEKSRGNSKKYNEL